MKAKVVFEFEVGDLPAYDDPTNPECKTNIVDLFHGMVLHKLDTRSNMLAYNPHGCDEHYLKASEEDLTLARRIMKGITYIGVADEHNKDTI